jgi:hypothetical protein
MLRMPWSACVGGFGKGDNPILVVTIDIKVLIGTDDDTRFPRQIDTDFSSSQISPVRESSCNLKSTKSTKNRSVKGEDKTTHEFCRPSIPVNDF